MNKKIVGILFIVLSIIISLKNLVITGNLIGTSTINIFNLIGTLFFIGGILLILVSRRNLEGLADEGIMLPSEAAARLNSIAGREKILVVDTSYVGAFSRIQVGDLLRGLGTEYSSIVVPDRVLNELDRSSKVKGPIDVLLGNSKTKESESDFKKYQNLARSYLEKSGKKRLRDELVPIILGEKEPPKTRREVEEMKKETIKIMGWLKRERYDVNRENIIYVLNNNYEVSDTDVDVLASAFSEAYKNPKKDIVVAEKDRDFEYAIDLIKNGGEGFKPHDVGQRIHYSTPYRSVA
ncbi:MAG: hypothetical protein ABIF88_01815 [archaeon]